MKRASFAPYRQPCWDGPALDHHHRHQGDENKQTAWLWALAAASCSDSDGEAGKTYQMVAQAGRHSPPGQQWTVVELLLWISVLFDCSLLVSVSLCYAAH